MCAIEFRFVNGCRVVIRFGGGGLALCFLFLCLIACGVVCVGYALDCLACCLVCCFYSPHLSVLHFSGVQVSREMM